MVANENAGRIILESEILKKKFSSLLLSLLNSKEVLEKISYNCKKLASPNASKNLYKLVTGVLNE